MDNDCILIKNTVLSSIEVISIQTDSFDIILRDSKGKGLKLYFDSKQFQGSEQLGSLMLNNVEKTISFELFEKDLYIINEVKKSDPNPAIIVELPIDKELKIFIETQKSDIYIAEEILDNINKKVFCKSEKGNILRKCFMYFDKVEV
ncbi:MAG: hypothetical protein FWG98_02000 [Candidatus Cloacimonetes bacterium]|nr:hypothetical protein [Candidatus Cloacimonadota bacterium]